MADPIRFRGAVGSVKRVREVLPRGRQPDGAGIAATFLRMFERELTEAGFIGPQQSASANDPAWTR